MRIFERPFFFFQLQLSLLNPFDNHREQGKDGENSEWEGEDAEDTQDNTLLPNCNQMSRKLALSVALIV